MMQATTPSRAKRTRKSQLSPGVIPVGQVPQARFAQHPLCIVGDVYATLPYFSFHVGTVLFFFSFFFCGKDVCFV